MKLHEVKGAELIGLPCAICGGLGQAEPKTERINKRLPAMLGFAVVFILLLLVFLAGLSNSNHFGELLAFCGPIIGTVLGFYYSTRRSDR
jgi:hypothetical protein